jgi:hypothetical protein
MAVKVLLPEALDHSATERLGTEVTAMAGVSWHPHIVTVYGAGVSDDDRPYMAMEFCPRPALNKDLRTTTRTVAEVLRIGVQIAGAVEVAHRAEVLHRDIKPRNILVAEDGTPAVADFGIAVCVAGVKTAVEGLSVPWSPPEAFWSSPWAGPSTDVWGLAATVYTLLAGRAPFEVVDGDNSRQAHIDRIRTAPLAPTGRSDVLPCLEQVLATAMDKDPTVRYTSALAFGNALRQVQEEMDLDPTPMILDATPTTLEAKAPATAEDQAADAVEAAERHRRPVVVETARDEAPKTAGKPALDEAEPAEEPEPKLVAEEAKPTAATRDADDDIPDWAKAYVTEEDAGDEPPDEVAPDAPDEIAAAAPAPRPEGDEVAERPVLAPVGPEGRGLDAAPASKPAPSLPRTIRVAAPRPAFAVDPSRTHVPEPGQPYPVWSEDRGQRKRKIVKTSIGIGLVMLLAAGFFAVLRYGTKANEDSDPGEQGSMGVVDATTLAVPAVTGEEAGISVVLVRADGTELTCAAETCAGDNQ